MPRLALFLVVAALILPSLARHLPAARPRRCAEEGRGEPPRSWLGCAADPGPRRDLSGDERLLLGVPLDLNRAGARELGFVPGLSPLLAAEVVADRSANGPFSSVEELVRVRGIGPSRLARSRAWLAVEPVRVGMADDEQ
ncbi:MAG TPA: helix-hairpin-helix domain-containing protein [Anaeromyxobacteraceae bacterium]|nr:helix-hairpin-helix domain-containing protein [Anaeromyxobacteraceae bacterium]